MQEEVLTRARDPQHPASRHGEDRSLARSQRHGQGALARGGGASGRGPGSWRGPGEGRRVRVMLLKQAGLGPREAWVAGPGGNTPTRAEAVHTKLAAGSGGVQAGPGLIEPGEGGGAAGGPGGLACRVRRRALCHPLELVAASGVARPGQRVVELIGGASAW